MNLRGKLLARGHRESLLLLSLPSVTCPVPLGAKSLSAAGAGTEEISSKGL